MHIYRDFPEFHDRSQLKPYVEPDLYGNDHHGQLANLSAIGKSRHDEVPVIARVGDGAEQRVPTHSAIGRGPRGEGLYVSNVIATDDTVSFGLYSTLTDELVWQSPNLAPPEIGFNAVDWRDLVPGEPTPLDITVKRGGKAKTDTVHIPAGQQGSLVYLYDEVIERNDDDTYAIPSKSLMVYSRYDYPSKPAPRPNDIIFFRFTDADGYGFAFGTIEDTGTLDTNVKPHGVDDNIVFTARTFIHVPEVSIGANGHWYAGGVDTGVTAQGPKGDKGDKGDKGETGEAGPQGPQGIQGPRGNNGNDGAPGKDGQTVKLRNAITATGDPGTDASIEMVLVNTATNEYDMIVTIPRGTDGSSLDMQNGVYTIADLPDYTTTAVNTAFIVDDGDGRMDLYVRGRIPVDAEDGGPWVVVENFTGGWDQVTASYGDSGQPVVNVTQGSDGYGHNWLNFEFNGVYHEFITDEEADSIVNLSIPYGPSMVPITSLTFNAGTGDPATDAEVTNLPAAITEADGYYVRDMLYVPDQVPVRNDYVFMYWQYGVSELQPGDAFWLNNASSYMEAVWQPEAVVITFNKNKTGKSALHVVHMPKNTTLEDGWRIGESKQIPLDWRPCYKSQGYFGFLGWSRTANGEPTIQPGDMFTPDSPNITLYAIWGDPISAGAVMFSPNAGRYNRAVVKPDEFLAVFDKTAASPTHGYLLGQSIKFANLPKPYFSEDYPNLSNLTCIGFSEYANGDIVVNSEKTYYFWKPNTTLYAKWGDPEEAE